MKTNILLPNYFKKIGAFLVPIGFLVWCLTQLGYFNEILINRELSIRWPYVTVLVASFFSFLFGIFFLVFVKEKREDEFIGKMRLQSFQRAAFLQFLYFTVAFLYMLIFKQEPTGDAGLELFLLFSIIIFWFFYVVHFNLSLYLINKKANEEQC
jgi:hypothetical protein